MLAITPMWWIMWGVFLASATMPATMRAGIGLIVLTAGLLAPAPHHPIHAGNGKEARTAGVEGMEPDMKGTYRIIDRRRRHGLIRLYLAGRPDPGYTGDDWDDSPYERNAGPVCQDFVDATPTLAVPWGLAAVEPADDWRTPNTRWSKNDFNSMLKVKTTFSDTPRYPLTYDSNGSTGGRTPKNR